MTDNEMYFSIFTFNLDVVTSECCVHFFFFFSRRLVHMIHCSLFIFQHFFYDLHDNKMVQVEEAEVALFDLTLLLSRAGGAQLHIVT